MILPISSTCYEYQHIYLSSLFGLHRVPAANNFASFDVLIYLHKIVLEIVKQILFQIGVNTFVSLCVFLLADNMSSIELGQLVPD